MINPLLSFVRNLYKRVKKAPLKRKIHLSIFSTYGLAKKHLRTKHKPGILVVKQEWKNLIVLDACRFDFFQLLNNVPGKLFKVTTCGTSTMDWLRWNFTDFYPDIAYVTGNVYLTKNTPLPYLFRGKEHFGYIDEVWKYGWSETQMVVPAEVLCEAALKTQKLLPKHRMIIHFMQPHEPYIGRIDFSIGKYPSVYQSWLKGEKIDYNTLRLAYASNLKYVLEKVKKLLPKLKGKTIITSDHGELLGEMDLFGHYPGCYLSKLVEIPWLVVTQ